MAWSQYKIADLFWQFHDEPFSPLTLLINKSYLQQEVVVVATLSTTL